MTYRWLQNPLLPVPYVFVLSRAIHDAAASSRPRLVLEPDIRERKTREAHGDEVEWDSVEKLKRLFRGGEGLSTSFGVRYGRVTRRLGRKSGQRTAGKMLESQIGPAGAAG